MKFSRTLKGLTVAITTTGILLPQAAVSAADTVRTTTVRERPAELFTDVALDSRGALQGQVVTVNGVPSKGSEVVVRQNTQELARTTTDAQGRFQFTGLKGGVYAISTPEETRTYRVWTHRAAPPSVSEGILFVNNATITRGQLPVVSSFGLGAIAVGVLATVVVASSVDHNSAS